MEQKTISLLIIVGVAVVVLGSLLFSMSQGPIVKDLPFEENNGTVAPETSAATEAYGVESGQ